MAPHAESSHILLNRKCQTIPVARCPREQPQAWCATGCLCMTALMGLRSHVNPLYPRFQPPATVSLPAGTSMMPETTWRGGDLGYSNTHRGEGRSVTVTACIRVGGAMLQPKTASSNGAQPHSCCVTRRKQHQPGITPNDNTTHVPTAGSSAALTKPNHTPTRHPRAKGKIIP